MNKNEFTNGLLQKLEHRQFDELFSRLKSVVRSTSFKYMEISIFVQQYSHLSQRKALGSMNPSHYQRALKQLSATLEEYILDLEETDLNIRFSKAKSSPSPETADYNDLFNFTTAETAQNVHDPIDSVDSVPLNTFADFEEPPIMDVPNNTNKKSKKFHLVGLFLSIIGLLFGLSTLWDDNQNIFHTSCQEELSAIKTNVSYKVERGKLRSAIDKIAEFTRLDQEDTNKITMLKSRCSNLENQKIRGVITSDEHDTKHNQIANNILIFCRQLECE